MSANVQWARLLFIGVLSFVVVACEEGPNVSVPTTASHEWQEYLRTFPKLKQWEGNSLSPNDLEAWIKLQQEETENSREANQRIVDRYLPLISSRTLGSVPVIDIKPRNWTKSTTVLIYLHGGSYTSGTMKSKVGNGVIIADTTGFRVISVDYTLAPRAKWQQITDEVIAVCKALEQEGYPLSNIAIIGSSSGGGLAAGAILKMRDQGGGMPAAVVLWSPWSDITETGDTYVTLKGADPTLAYRFLKASANAYADVQDQKHPYVSPIYGDYTRGFPPTLIQGGTKEIFLSNFIRQYQAIDSVGQIAKLDLYDGMIHTFQVQLPESPESQLALKKTKQFLEKYLNKIQPPAFKESNDAGGHTCRRDPCSDSRLTKSRH